MPFQGFVSHAHTALCAAYIINPWLGKPALPGQATRALSSPQVQYLARPQERNPVSVGQENTTYDSPDDEAAVFSRVDSDIGNNKLDQAEEALKDFLTRKPQSAGALYRLGRVYFDRHDWARSAAYLQHSIELAPDNDRAHMILGLDFFQSNELQEAEKELLTAVKLNPKSDENQYMAGRFFFSKFKRSDALPFFYQAVRLNPRNYKAYHSLGLCFANLGDYALAEHYYKQAIEVSEEQNNKFFQAYLDLADLLTGIESAKVPEGEVFARRATELSPESPHAHYLLGKALYRQGRLTEAVPQLRKAVTLDPSDGLPHFLLGKIYQKMGQEDEARAEWGSFHRLMNQKTRTRQGLSRGGPATVR